jgi:membrane protein DedA with SNARE-associated domain
MITGLAESGYLGIGLLMFLENLFPPIPSELIMPLAGFIAGDGRLSLVGVVLAGSAGSLAGTTFWYVLARRYGKERLKRLAERHGRWLTVEPADIERADAWLDRHGGKVVLLGRLVPTVRTLISIPAGFCGMAPGKFLVLTAIGTVAWTSALALAGHGLGERYDEVSAWIAPVANTILAAIGLTWLWRVATWRRHRA